MAAWLVKNAIITLQFQKGVGGFLFVYVNGLTMAVRVCLRRSGEKKLKNRIKDLIKYRRHGVKKIAGLCFCSNNLSLRFFCGY